MELQECTSWDGVSGCGADNSLYNNKNNNK